MMSAVLVKRLRVVTFAFALGGELVSCASARRDPDPPSYTEIRPVLDARCARCHAGFAPAAGWRADSYVGAIACTASSPRVTEASGANVLRALDRPDHADFVASEERDSLIAWVRGGASSVRSGAHPVAFGNPATPSGHANALRADRYRALLDPEHPDACARCHDGVGQRSATITSGAPGATACTSCHAEPGFPFACTTCHGPDSRSSRNPCFHGSARDDRAHLSHAGPSASRVEGLPCSTCHAVPAEGRPSAIHANGWAEVYFDRSVAGANAQFDPATKRCTGTCHARGGARPELALTDAPVTCNDCHRTPPANHFPPPCSSCHETNTEGTSLVAPKLHVNGRIDVAGAPTTGAHPAHLAPESAVAVSCETCHTTPFANGVVAVKLGRLATKGGRKASFDPVTKTCAGTYCHEGAGGLVPAPSWTTGAPARACGACHSIPPPPPHPPSTDCATCHSGMMATAHVDGVIDF